MLGHELWVKPSQDGDLVIAPNRRQNRLDLRIGKRRHQICRARLRGRAHLTGGRVLNRFQTELITQPTHR
jgi:hypothetical protein